MQISVEEQGKVKIFIRFKGSYKRAYSSWKKFGTVHNRCQQFLDNIDATRPFLSTFVIFAPAQPPTPV